MNGVVAAPGQIVGLFCDTQVTVPKHELRHYITDGELDMIGEMRRDHMEQVFWAAVGVLGGASIPAIDALSHFNAPENPMGWLGFLQCLLAAMAFVAAVLSGYLVWHRSKTKSDLVTEIRARPRMKVVQ